MILATILENHLGAELYNRRAQEAILWSDQCNLTEDASQSWETGQTYRSKNQKESVLPHEALSQLGRNQHEPA